MTSIVDTRRATDEEWDAACRSCDYATYFHSRPWAELWSEYSGGRMRPAPELVTFSDGPSAVIARSRQDIHGGLVPRYLLSPAGTFGGWVSQHDLSDAHSRLLADRVSSVRGRVEWRLNPYAPLRAVRGATDDDTHALRLDSDFDVVHKRWSRGNRSATRKAEKSGLEVRVATDRRDWEAYFAAYEDSLDRWGEDATSRYEWRLFELLFTRSSDDVRLWIARQDDQVAAGALCLYARRHVVYWHGATRKENFALRPMNLVMAAAIRHACEGGYHWFDFNPSAGLDGVRRFKRSFGAEPLPAPVLKHSSTSARAVERALGAARRLRQLAR